MEQLPSYTCVAPPPSYHETLKHPIPNNKFPQRLRQKIPRFGVAKIYQDLKRHLSWSPPSPPQQDPYLDLLSDDEYTDSESESEDEGDTEDTDPAGLSCCWAPAPGHRSLSTPLSPRSSLPASSSARLTTSVSFSHASREPTTRGSTSLNRLLLESWPTHQPVPSYELFKARVQQRNHSLSPIPNNEFNRWTL
ncbi:hypothetical protein DM01DRAFT_1331357 [Hesseltinella vesiculosa]|uniref:Uncharacterized protein n=1 Tax=Hesseltinella vesiculosa TaxID=101127 RepID=A0A1X2GV27_9FUNG|nr:hypothetical protein DM01DRAFT_1331357 [Hesseltinella vesiculosa]